MRAKHWALVLALISAAGVARAQDDGPSDGKSFNITAKFQAQAIVAAPAPKTWRNPSPSCKPR